MPKQTPEFRDEQFTAVTGEGAPTQVQPGVVRWTPTYTPETETSPVLKVDFVVPGTTSTPLLQSVTVSDIVATTVTITVFVKTGTTSTPVYSVTLPIPESGTVTVYFSPDDKLPVEASFVEIALGEPKKPDDTTYDTTITFVGCFEPLAGK
jgi:hypothetical protein